jgi:2-methylcitrate dehydratase PrpD
MVGQVVWVVTEQFDSIYHPESPKKVVAVFDTREKALDLVNQEYPKGFSHYIEEMEIS